MVDETTMYGMSDEMIDEWLAVLDYLMDSNDSMVDFAVEQWVAKGRSPNEIIDVLLMNAARLIGSNGGSRYASNKMSMFADMVDNAVQRSQRVTPPQN